MSPSYTGIARKKIGRLIMNFLTSGTFDRYRDDVGVYLRFILINAIGIVAGTCLVGYGIHDITHDLVTIGWITMGTAVLVVGNIIFLRVTGRYRISGWFIALLLAVFFAMLLSTGGKNNTGPLWIYTLPGIAFILLGTKAGTILMIGFYAYSALVLLVPDSPLLLTSYPPDFIRRFFSTLFTVLFLVYLFVYMRVLSQKRIVAKNRELEDAIDEARRVEQALRESETRFRDISFSMADWIWEVDRDGVYTYASGSVKQILGYEPDELIGKTPFDLMSPAEAERVGATFKKIVAEKEPLVDLENWNLTKSGGKVCLLTNGVPILDDAGNLLGYRGVDKDITVRRRMEDEMLKTQKLESVGILAGGIAHDFNNILTAILGNVSFSKTGVVAGGEPYRALCEAEQACRQAKNLTQQLLTFSRGGLPIKKNIAIGGLIREAATLALRGSCSRCDFSIPPGLKPVEVDAGQINQAINNIVLNAGQSMPGGGVVRVSADNCPVEEKSGLALPEGEYLRITILDEGAGIPTAILHRIFDPYFTTKKEGSGLGLAAAYSIIKNHDGLITVDSEEGVRTTFTVHLPVSGKEDGMKEETSRQLIYGQGRVLLMDDEEMVRRVTGRMIQHIGYEVEVSVDGSDAVEKYRAARDAGNPFDIVILDLTVPGGMDGRSAAEEILKIDPAARLIVTSGYSSEAISSIEKEQYFCDVLIKPYQIKELSEVLERVMKGD